MSIIRTLAVVLFLLLFAQLAWPGADVDQGYLTAYGRKATPAEHSYWQHQQAPPSQEAFDKICMDYLVSANGAALLQEVVIRGFKQFYDREPTADELQVWEGKIKSSRLNYKDFLKSMVVFSMPVVVLDLPEVSVSAGYLTAYGRIPTDTELEYWKIHKLPGTQKAFDEICTAYLLYPKGAAELQAVVTRGFQEVFQRNPSVSELQEWGDKIKASKLTYKNFATALKGSSANMSIAKTVFVSPEKKIVNVTATNAAGYQAWPGEIQSTVVPPGLKDSCPAGRLVVTNDLRIVSSSTSAPQKGMVVYRDLNNDAAATQEATFDAAPDPANHFFCTNDHDIVTLSNGDLLFVTGAASKSPLNPAPSWWFQAYRDNFGPGTRSVVDVWKSVDCGETFQYLSEMDPAIMEDGTCAFPQFRQDEKHQIIHSHRFDMGGSDGQLVKVNRNTDDVYLTFQCVGYQADPNANGFMLSETHLDKTLIAFAHEGKDWQSLGFMPKAEWRIGIVPVSQSKIAIGFSNYITFVDRKSMPYVYDTALPAPDSTVGWQEPYTLDHAPETSSLMHANMFATTVIAASPGSKNLIFAFPQTTSQDSHGYRLFFFNPDSKQFAEMDSVVPLKPGIADVIMHLTMVSPAPDGPVLLYWYDVDSKANTSQIRGRLITADQEYSSDFDISKVFSLSTSFSAGGAYWYGDYLTAGATATTYPSGTPLYTYYPIWIEPDHNISYTRIAYPAVGIIRGSANLTTKQITAKQWLAGGSVEKVSSIQFTKLEQETLVNYGKKKPVISFLTSTGPAKQDSGVDINAGYVKAYGRDATPIELDYWHKHTLPATQEQFDVICTAYLLYPKGAAELRAVVIRGFNQVFHRPPNPEVQQQWEDKIKASKLSYPAFVAALQRK